jgi:two-component system LytT family sensor kinase
MNSGESLVALLFFAVASVWLFIKLRRTRTERDALTKELQRLTVLKDALVKEKVELEAENALLSAEHLKFQLQPHTLNNILANLKTIATKLSRGMDALSETLEYILYKGRTNLVSVKDELDFLQTYLRLNDLFLTGVDAIVIETKEVDRASPYFEQACIPHLISAYFIENAFKHGDQDHPEFLRIRVKLDHHLFQLQVTNRIRQKPDARLGGLGLQNMEKRLELLMNGRYRINTSSTQEEYHAILTIQLSA